MLVLEVVQSITALAFSPRLEVSQEVVIGRVAAPHLLHGDELLVLDEEDAVAVPDMKIVEGFENCSFCQLTHVLFFLISSKTFLQSSAIATPDDMIKP